MIPTRTSDARHSSPAALRNREPILDILRDVVPTAGTVLEVASGSGEHAIYFAANLPALTWQPSDPSVNARASIAGWIETDGPFNLLTPLAVDATASVWPVDRAAAIVAINMVHISPWAATLGLLRHAARILPSGGPLFLYGPYRRDHEPMAPSNEAFDADLRDRNAEWGIRRLEDVASAAEAERFALDRVVPMPANNLSVVFRRL